MSTQTTTLSITGMSCGHCVEAVRKNLSALAGVTVHDVTVGHAVIESNPDAVTMAQLSAAVEDAGFSLDPVTEWDDGDTSSKD